MAAGISMADTSLMKCLRYKPLSGRFSALMTVIPFELYKNKNDFVRRERRLGCSHEDILMVT